MAKFNIYTVQDKTKRIDVDGVLLRYEGLLQCSSDDELIRTHLFRILMDLPLRDIKLFQIGTFNDETAEIVPMSPREVDLSKCYRIPRSTLSPEGDDVPLEEFDKAAKKFKAESMARLVEQNEIKRQSAAKKNKK